MQITTNDISGQIDASVSSVSKGGSSKEKPEKVFGTMSSRAGAIADIAARRFRSVVQAKITASNDKKVLLSSLDSEQRAAFSTVLLMDCLKGIELMLDRPVPKFIMQNDRLYITGSMFEYQGRPWFSLFLSVPTKDGKQLTRGAGVFSRKDW